MLCYSWLEGTSIFQTGTSSILSNSIMCCARLRILSQKGQLNMFFPLVHTGACTMITIKVPWVMQTLRTQWPTNLLLIAISFHHQLFYLIQRNGIVISTFDVSYENSLWSPVWNWPNKGKWTFALFVAGF